MVGGGERWDWMGFRWDGMGVRGGEERGGEGRGYLIACLFVGYTLGYVEFRE